MCAMCVSRGRASGAFVCRPNSSKLFSEYHSCSERAVEGAKVSFTTISFDLFMLDLTTALIKDSRAPCHRFHVQTPSEKKTQIHVALK